MGIAVSNLLSTRREPGEAAVSSYFGDHAMTFSNPKACTGNESLVGRQHSSVATTSAVNRLGQLARSLRPPRVQPDRTIYSGASSRKPPCLRAKRRLPLHCNAGSQHVVECASSISIKQARIADHARYAVGKSPILCHWHLNQYSI